MIRRACMFFAAAVLIALPSVASAMTIEKIVSPSGIEAWLVREKSVPLVTLNYAFRGGASQDDADKSGAAHFAADLLDEGAGDLDSDTFQTREDDLAMKLSFDTGLELDECPIVGQAHDTTSDTGANRILRGYAGPGVGALLFQAERNASSLSVVFEHAHFHLVADVEHF